MGTRKQTMRRLASTAAAVMLALQAGAGGLRPDAVVSFTPGQGANFGQDQFPANVLNGPNGGENPPFVPSDDPGNLLSLGDGGAITLAWTGDVIVDGPGPDFIVFENVLETFATGVPFIEGGVVLAGQREDALTTFTFAFLPPTGWSESAPYAQSFFASNYDGLAGTRATLVTPTNGIDPANALLAGGNAFDLADVGLGWARYIRIVDAGTPGRPHALRGANGLPVYDTVPAFNGFDLDTVIAINTGPAPGPSSTSASWSLLE